MHFAGVLPEDAPDPRIAAEAKLAAMPVPILTLVPQPHLEDAGALSITTSTDGAGVRVMSVSVGYTLWRNPADPTDPINLADLDDRMARSLDDVPPWPRPAWLIAAVQRMRYPSLSEAVRTTWHADRSTDAALPAVLADHARHVVMNHFREAAGIEGHNWDSPALPRESGVRQGVVVRIDDTEVNGAELDTDPFVYAVGAELSNGSILTAVLPRDELSYVELAFTARTPPPAAEPA